jgi:hypothetical protein
MVFSECLARPGPDLADRLALCSRTNALADYGTVQWNERQLDTVFFQLSVGLKHREPGKYQPACFLLGAIVDTEIER